MILRAVLFFIFTGNAIAIQTMSALDIYSQEERKVPIAIVTSMGPDFGILGSVSKIINENLNSTARFNSFERHVDTIPLNDTDLHAVLQNFRNLKMDNVAIFTISSGNANNTYIIKMSLYDVFSEGIIVEKKYSIVSTGTRKLSHIISNVIMLSLVGYEGDFDTKLIYVDEFGYGQKNKIRKLAVVDRDGYNQRYLSSGGLAMTPTYSMAKKQIFYSDFTGGVPRINILDVITGKISDLSKVYPSLASYKLISPSISQDGNSLAFTIMQDNNSNIYNLDFTTSQFTKLTTNGLNVSSCFSPDGTHIVYTTNSNGKPTLYIMASNGWNPHRVTFERGHYMEPEWSPNGEWIAFTRILNNIFSIGIIRPDGRDERILYSGYDAEGPAWSPSSTQIAFSFRQKNDKKAKIKIIDLKGNELRILDTTGNASDVTWVKIE